MRLHFVFIIVPCLLVPKVNASEVLMILFENRYPKFYTDKGVMLGKQYQDVSATLNSMNIEHRWIASSYKRILQTLSASPNQVCTVGYSKKPDRVNKYVFSKPIYQIGHSIILTYKINIPAFESYLTFNDLIMKSSFSGAFINIVEAWYPAVEAIKATRNRHIIYNDGDNIALDLLSNNRVDFIRVDQFAAEYYMKENPDKNYGIHKYPYLIKERAAHLMCSKNIDPEFIKAFNEAYNYDQLSN